MFSRLLVRLEFRGEEYLILVNAHFRPAVLADSLEQEDPGAALAHFARPSNL